MSNFHTFFNILYIVTIHPGSFGEGVIWLNRNLAEYHSIIIEFNISFEVIDDTDVGRHGGVIVNSKSPTDRWDTSNGAVIFDWIDRASDKGYRTYHSGAASVLNTLPKLEPTFLWRIVIDEERKICEWFTSGESWRLLFKLPLPPSRSNRLIGFWTFNQTKTTIDNLVIRKLNAETDIPLK